MKQLVMCMKKEWLELCRTKKLLFYILFAFALVLFALAVVLVMDFVGQNVDVEEGDFSNIVLAKIVVLCLAALLPAVAAFLVNTLVGGLAFGNSGAAAVSAGDLFQLGLCAAVTIFQFSVLTIALSAITGHTGATAAISVGVYLFGGLVLGLFDNFIYYTPLMFQTVAMGGGAVALSAANWIVASLSSVVILAALIYFAMFKQVK